MKPLMLVILSLVVLSGALSGCVVVPAYGPPGVYAPAVVVPYGGYYGGHYGGHHGGYGYRGGYR